MSHSGFEERVVELAQLKSLRPRELQEASVRARLTCLQQNARRFDPPEPVTPRFVYKTLFFDKMGLRPEVLSL